MKTADSITVDNEILLSEVGRLLKEGHEVIITAKGGSMMPFIVGGRDSVALTYCSEPAVGDIVLARLKEGCYVMHRIVAIEGDSLSLMGDGNLCGGERCRKEDLLGKAVAVIKPSGRRIAPRSGRIWLRLKPLRRYILGIYRRILRIENYL
ncbi:MAG: S24/S26 family peptidase [Bacteroidales bacterium]|nr:S24/S26 family peptidase [Candidatus Cacconaster caballi]